jgi:Bacterial lipid A biosynthesis acyltransferase
LQLANADARRMNAFLEERILEMSDQYFWVHKRFKRNHRVGRFFIVNPSINGILEAKML